jgi:alkylation response protein AidB-like acyl-CoA dehydrogenase
VDFELSDDQMALRDELRRFLEARCTPEVRRAAMAMPGAVDRSLWAGLRDMGVFSLRADGLGLAEATIVFEELGRSAVPGPVIATFLADGLVDGDVVGAVTSTTPTFVEHLDALDALLLIDGAVSAVPRPAGVVEPRPLDPLTPVSTVDGVTTGPPLDADAGALLRTGGLLAAAMQVGLGQAALELGTAYAGQRQQFGKPIGTFQAVKHLLADAAVEIEIARAGVHAAAVAIDEGGSGGGRAMSVDAARLVASEAARVACANSVQVHGGIGFTWELDVHLFLKRALVLDVSFGSVDDAVAAVAANL